MMIRMLWYRLRALLTGRRIEGEIDREMAFHADMETDALVRAGMPADEARRRAHVAFGGRQRFREETRDQVRSRPVEDLVQDLRHAWRAFGRAPAFTTTVLLSLALGIGSTTVIFSITDHVVLRALPYGNADRLVNVQVIADPKMTTTPVWPPNAAHFLAWQRGCTVCEGMAAIRAGTLILSASDDPVKVSVMRVSDNLFTMLGAHAELGRLFAAGDDRPGNEHSIVITDALWRQHLGGRRDIIGRPVTMSWQSGSQQSTVVGVLPPDFHMLGRHELNSTFALPAHTDAFVPLALTARERTTPGEHDYGVIALLKPGASVAALRSQLDAVTAANAARLHDTPPSRVVVSLLQDSVVGAAGRPLMLLLAAVSAMLLILCVNLTTLFLARSAAQRREAAVRVALGAARGRLVRQILAETMALAFMGGIIGIALSRWGLRALIARAPADLPRLDEVHLDPRVLLVALGVSLAVGLAFGLVPALRFGRVDPGDVLKETTRGAQGGRRSARVQGALIASQVALSMLLLVVAGLFLRSFVRVMHADRGFTAERVLALDVQLPPATYPKTADRNAFLSNAMTALSALPGVTAAGVTNTLPLEGDGWVDGLRREADPANPAGVDHELDTDFRFVSPNFFELLGVPILRGRTFTEADRGQRRVILSAGAARALWPNENAVGKRVYAGSDSLSEVIGVAADVRTGIEAGASPALYRPYWDIGFANALLIRTAGDPTSVATSARAALRRVAASVAVSNVRTIGQVVSASVARRRFELMLVGLFALIALVTASVGIYGIISHSLGLRTGEISIRMALGARASSVHALILREVLVPVGVGLVVGLLASTLVGRAIAGLLFEVQPTDSATFVAVAAILASVAMVAAWVPARRATRIDPVEALRAA